MGDTSAPGACQHFSSVPHKFSRNQTVISDLAILYETMYHDHRILSPTGRKLLERLRKIALKFPECHETLDGFGHTAFRVGKKTFIMMGEGPDGTALAIKATRQRQAELIESGRYIRTPYIGQHGWVTLAGKKQNWKEIEGLIADAYCLAAPQRLSAKL